MKQPAFPKIKYLLLLLLIPAVLLTSCSGEKAKTAASTEEDSYDIWYLDKSLSSLYPVRYHADTKDTDTLLAELMTQFLTVPNKVDAVAAPDEKTEYLGCSLDGNIVTVRFSDQYSSMKASRTALCNAALVSTLTQVSGVEHVNIYAGDQPLQNRDGTPTGPLSASDFIRNITNVNSYEKKELVLYFPDAAGTKLAEEKREIVHSMDTSLERVVVEQLIKGPLTEGCRSAISPTTKILSISVNDDVCYLNLSSDFLTPVQGTDGKLAVYSIVNSLSELTTVKKLQIAVEGSQKIMLFDTISLDTLFERNLDYLEEPKTEELKSS